MHLNKATKIIYSKEEVTIGEVSNLLTVIVATNSSKIVIYLNFSKIVNR